MIMSENELKLKALEIANKAEKKRNQIKWIKRLLILSGIGAVCLGIYWLYTKFKVGKIGSIGFDTMTRLPENMVKRFQTANLSLTNKFSQANMKVFNKFSGANVKVMSKTSQCASRATKKSTNIVQRVNPVKVYSSVYKKSKKKGGWPF